MRRLLLLLPVLGVLLVTVAPAAEAGASVSQVVAGLRSDQVFLDPAAQVPLDEPAVRDAVRGSRVQVYVAAVPASLSQDSGGDAELVRRLGTSLADASAVVLLLTDAPSVYADNSTSLGRRGVNAGAVVRSVPRGEFDRAGVTAFAEDVVRGVDDQLAGRSSRTGSGSGVLLPLVVAGGLGVGAWSLLGSRRRRRRDREALRVSLEDARADVESLYARLGSDVSLLSAGDDEVARQALVDAAERYTSTGALLATADTPGELAAARRTAAEGLAAARVARTRLGLDPGPDVPVPAEDPPQQAQVGSLEGRYPRRSGIFFGRGFGTGLGAFGVRTRSGRGSGGFGGFGGGGGWGGGRRGGGGAW